jgi:beta-glucosidase
LQELLKTGKPVVLVLFTGRPLVLVQENETVPAILNTWFAGSEAGNPLQMSCLVMKILLVN